MSNKKNIIIYSYEKEECERELFLTGDELKERKTLDVYEKSGIWKSLNRMVLHQFM